MPPRKTEPPETLTPEPQQPGAQAQVQTAPGAPPTVQQPGGQWVWTSEGWVWQPHGDQYVHAPAGAAYPQAYVYYPAFGWRWVAAPWIGSFGYGHGYGWGWSWGWGWGPSYYWGPAYTWPYPYYRGGYGWGHGGRGHWSPGVRPAPHRPNPRPVVPPARPPSGRGRR